MLFGQFLDTCPRLFTYDDLIDRTMEISSDMRIGVFDCLYVALAEKEHCRVATVDKRFLELFPNLTIPLSAL